MPHHLVQLSNQANLNCRPPRRCPSKLDLVAPLSWSSSLVVLWSAATIERAWLCMPLVRASAVVWIEKLEREIYRNRGVIEPL